MIRIFRLDHSFVRGYAKKTVPWGWKSGPNSLGEIVCMRTYSRVKPETGKNEAWYEICERVVNGVFKMLETHVRVLRLEWDEGHAQRLAQEMYDRLFNMKFMPPGRGLWSMGTDITEKRDLYAALFNCFTGDTKFITKEYGPISFADVLDKKVTVWTEQGWKPALVSRFGNQKVRRVTFAPAMPNTRSDGHRKMRTNYRVTVEVTTDHRWILTNGEETTYLKYGDFVKSGLVSFDKNLESSITYRDGFVHGLFFADGSMSYEATNHYSHVMRLCGKKAKYSNLFSNVTYPPSANGDPYVHVKHTTNFKELPKETDHTYLRGFLDGVIAGDSTQPKCETTKILATQSPALVEWVKTYSAFCGYMVTGLNADTRPTNFGERSGPCYKISLSTNTHNAWVVTNIEQLELAPVYCATVPEVGSFTLGSGVYTGNCAFTSTKDIKTEKFRPFTFAMDALMLGIGVGFDVKGAGKITVKKRKGNKVTYVIPDSREGWVEALQMLLQSFFEGTNPVVFDYNKIRKAGLPIKGFGGKSSGPEPLMKLFEQISEILTKRAGKLITARDIVDIFNMIGCCVVAGNIRRSAEIAIGPSDEEFVDLKNYDKNPERAMFGWTSNNSVEAELGMDYESLCERIIKNGEPGFLWLDNARSYGRIVDGIDRRDNKIEGTNPCGEIGLESYELCVDGSTRLQTKNGADHIVNYCGKEVEIWNGVEWSKVTVVKTTSDSALYKVTFTDGSELICTAYHKFYIENCSKEGSKIVQTQCLKKGMKLISYSLGEIAGRSEKLAYEYGYVAGDGFVDHKSKTVRGRLYNDDLNIQMNCKRAQVKHANDYNVLSQYVQFDNLDFELCVNLREKHKLDAWVFEMDAESTRKFISGYIDTDGTVSKQENTDNYVIYGSQERLQDLQILLRRIGVNHSSVYMVDPFDTNKGKRSYTLYGLLIPSYECHLVSGQIKKCKRFGTDSKINPRYPNGECISTRRRQRIEKIEYYGRGETFCFTEPKTHKGVFNNVITGQCNLVEIFPCNHTNKEDFLRTVKFAYLYSKIITLSTTQWPDSNRVMLRNRRIGVSLSGIQQFITKNGINVFRGWCFEGYDALKHWDKVYSEWLCIPRSIKMSTIKPSGTISLLAGATPGMHWPVYNYHIRRIRVATGSELHKILAKAGYHIEDAVNEANTVVVEIPVEPLVEIRDENSVSMWEQLEMTAFLQHYWADNQVSCTVKFDPEKEGPEMARALEYYQYHLKGISFLPKPRKGVKIYPQMPYEPITKEEYIEKTRKLRRVDFSVLTVKEGGTDKYCSNDTCTL